MGDLYSVADLHRAKPADGEPWLLCLDMQREYSVPGRPLFSEGVEVQVERCREILAAARAACWRIVHVQMHRQGALFAQGGPYARPIPGLEPRTDEPVFLRTELSALSCEGFRALARSEPGAEFHLIGFSMTGSGLATLFSGFDLGVRITVVEDAVGGAAAGLLERGKLGSGFKGVVAQLGDVISCASLTDRMVFTDRRRAAFQ